MELAVDELMTVVLARLIPDHAPVQVGAGVPLCLAAACLAKLTHAPDITFFPFGLSGIESRAAFMLTLRALEAGAYGACVPHDPMTILTRTEATGAVEPLAPAQVDADGNINTIAIGGYPRPLIRLPGLGGVDLIGTMPAPMILYTTRHSPRVLVSAVDLVMSPGRCRRRQLGIEGNGPSVLVTNLAVFEADPDGRWRARSVHPGVRWEEVRAATGFPLPPTGPAAETELPTAYELSALREKVDPFGIRRLEFVPARDRGNELRRIMARERAWLIETGLLGC